jgi:hypothetical protein
MKNAFKWIGIAAIAVSAVFATVIKIDASSVIAIAAGAFGVASLVGTLVESASKETDKVRIGTYICAGLAGLGGIGMAVGGLAESDITTIVSAVVAVVTVLLSFKLSSSSDN